MINDRISALINALEVTPNRFSESIEVNPTVVHNIIKGRRSKPSYEVLEKIIQTYKKVNAEWLLTGKGSIWRKKSSILGTNYPDSKDVEARVLKLVERINEMQPEMHETYELKELMAHLIDKNDVQQKKLVKMYDRQEEIIKTLMRMKKSF